ncbi:MAG: HAD family hydrolase [Promethearchaeota archaeon]
MKNEKIKAILFDLDNTLLNIDENGFNNAFAQELANEAAHLISREVFIKQWYAAVYETIKNEDKRINLDKFWNYFCDLVNISRDTIEPILVNNYKNKFEGLKRFVTKKEEARKVIQLAFDLGLDVIIATNPIYLEVGMKIRLKWADIIDFPYRLITHIENSCYCKPSLKYYEEIFEKIGHPAKDCLMIGDLNGDMVAANLGCSTFLIQNSYIKLDSNIPKPTYRGTLVDLIKLLKNWK